MSNRNQNQHDILAVALDLDGLMFNTEQLYKIVGTELLSRRGHKLDARLVRQMTGRPARNALPLMIEWYGLNDTVEQLQQETETLFRQILEDKLRPMPGLLRLLAMLDQAGLPRAITTSSHRRYVENVLRIAGLRIEFDFILTAEDVTLGKPDPEIYQQAADRFQIETRQLLVFEDSEHGCRAAVRAGAYTVAVPGEHQREHDYQGAAHVVHRLDDPVVDALFGGGDATP